MHLVSRLAMAMVLVGCGCTDVGCGNDIRFDAATVASWIGSQAFTMTVCAEGECQTLRVSDASQSDWFGFEVDPDASGELDVELTVTAGAETRDASGTIELGSYRPNKGLCPPVCPEADVGLEGDVLRNAEPGSITPRD
ncbi:MAG TPA: hypothetical protein VGC03_05635 [Acidimicrobiia bacterium]